jgi:hypothetical protein
VIELNLSGSTNLIASSKHTEGCLVCGKELLYSDQAQVHKCLFCQKEFTSTIHCSEGHYICDECHRADASKIIEALTQKSSSTNPIQLAKEIMASPAFQMHGPEHHNMVPIVILTTLRNLGVELDERQFQNAWIRSKQLPGGICGSWGACGAALGAGIALSVTRNLTSLSREIWGQSNQDTGEILKAVGEYGGPRCCKRSSFSALRAVIKILERDGVVQFPKTAHEIPVCKDFWRNKQCLKISCPYYPRPEES